MVIILVNEIIHQYKKIPIAPIKVHDFCENLINKNKDEMRRFTTHNNGQNWGSLCRNQRQNQNMRFDFISWARFCI